MEGGVYEIVNKANGKSYVGSARSFRKRFCAHRNHLRRRTHGNAKLQCAWEKYGEQAFEFRPLLVCDAAALLMYEQIAMDALRPEYNICQTAGNTLGVRWSEEAKARVAATRTNDHFKGRKHSPQTRALMSAAQRGNTATLGKKRDPAAVEATAAAHRGMKRSDECKLRMSEAMRATWARRRDPQ